MNPSLLSKTPDPIVVPIRTLTILGNIDFKDRALDKGLNFELKIFQISLFSEGSGVLNKSSTMYWAPIHTVKPIVS